MMHGGTSVDGTIISAPSLTKKAEGKRDEEMHQVKKWQILQNKNMEYVIHQSQWARTVKDGNRVKKYFLNDNFEKIKREVDLLRISSGIQVDLYYDEIKRLWVQEMPYIDHKELFAGNANITFRKMRTIITYWNNSGVFNGLIEDDWCTKALPYWKKILESYGDFFQAAQYLQSTRGECFIHGDFQIMNVLKDYSDNLIVLDFENAGTGPKLWDETTMVYSLVEDKRYDLAKEAMIFFGCRSQMLKCIASIRLAQAIKKNVGFERRKQALDYVTSYFD